MPGKEVTVFFGSKPKTSLREKLYPCSVRRIKENPKKYFKKEKTCLKNSPARTHICYGTS
jgi:hypothetical protein